MTLVGEQDVLHRHVAALQVRDDLLRFDDRNVRVVGAVLDHQRGLDPIELAERRQVPQQIGLGLRIAVLGRGDRGHPRFRVLEEREEIDHAV